jgi:hypothetical protein
MVQSENKERDAPSTFPQSLSRTVDPLDKAPAAASDTGPNGLAAVLRDYISELSSDRLERLIPNDPDELSNSLRSGATHWMRQAIGRASVVQVIHDLVAQRSARVGMSRSPRSSTGWPFLMVKIQLQVSGQSSGQAPPDFASPSLENHGSLTIKLRQECKLPAALDECDCARSGVEYDL